MSKTINKITIILCIFSIISLPAIVYGNDKLVTNLEAGQKAPFKGILLSNSSAAKLFADIKFSKKECDAILSEKLEIEKIKNLAKINLLSAKIEIESKKTQALLSVRDDRIRFLEKNYMPPAWYEQGEFWLAVGVVTGIGVTIASGYAIGQAK